MKEPKPRRAAPVCYGHPGGILGERLCAALVGKGWLALGKSDPLITAAGLRGLARLGLPVERLATSKRKPVNLCVERHAGRLYPHLGSHLSSLLAETFQAKGWLAIDGRDFRLLPAGRRGLVRLGVDLKGID
jgi:hypothetical protein